MIICGHALIGKSTLAQKEPVCIDLESSVFCQGNFDKYAQMILTLHQQGKVVLTSCHGALREILRLSRISYLLVLPHPKEKDRYYDLAKARQPHPLKPELVLSQWDNWQEHKKDENVYRLPLGKHLSEVFVVCGRGKYALDPCLALAAERGGRMSKTPRTDEQILHHDNGNGHPSAFVFASFARELEEELIELRARIDHLERIVDEMTEEQAALCAEDQSITELVAAKDKLIEQMREALKTVVSSAPPGGPLWYGSAEIEKAVAAIKAAERGE